eukprot:409018_1
MEREILSKFGLEKTYTLYVSTMQAFTCSISGFMVGGSGKRRQFMKLFTHKWMESNKEEANNTPISNDLSEGDVMRYKHVDRRLYKIANNQTISGIASFTNNGTYKYFKSVQRANESEYYKLLAMGFTYKSGRKLLKEHRDHKNDMKANIAKIETEKIKTIAIRKSKRKMRENKVKANSTLYDSMEVFKR